MANSFSEKHARSGWDGSGRGGRGGRRLPFGAALATFLAWQCPVPAEGSAILDYHGMAVLRGEKDEYM